MLPFFGLTPEYRAALFKQIHEIVFHGQGGYDFMTVYNMPIWLRSFTFRSIQEYYKEQKKEQDKAMTNAKSKQSIPKSTYSVKARR